MKPTVILSGPTATGKTALALSLPKHVEIINADSLLFYRGMDIGTAKPTPEELLRKPHHLINICEPNEPVTAGDFSRLAHQALQEIHSRGHRAIVVGGSGFYLKALLYGVWDAPAADPVLRAELETVELSELHRRLKEKDPRSAERIPPGDRYRVIRALEIIQLTGNTPTELEKRQPQTPNPDFLLWAIDRPKEELEKRIHQRTIQMIQSGLINETKSLLAQFPNARPLKSIGYAQVIDYLNEQPPQGRKIRQGLEGLIDEIDLATRQLVKKQRTWFNGEKATRWFKLEQDLNTLEQELLANYA